MANNVKKSEHSGPKIGMGHWGHKQEAKKEGNKLRRKNDVLSIQNDLHR